MVLSVRPIREDEHHILADVTVAAYRAALGAALAGEYVATLRAVGARVRSDTVLVAVDGGRVLGGATFVADPSSPNAEFPEAADAGIRYLAVAPGAQGRGVGAALVGDCLARARRAGKSRVVLHTQREMTAAQRLYDRLGFTRAPELDWEPLPGVQLVAFTYDLAGRPRTAAPRAGSVGA